MLTEFCLAAIQISIVRSSYDVFVIMILGVKFYGGSYKSPNILLMLRDIKRFVQQFFWRQKFKFRNLILSTPSPGN